MIAATATPLTTGRVHGRVGRASPIAAHAAPNKGSAAGAVDTLSSFANPQKDNGRAGNWSSPKSLLPIHGEVARSAGGAAENPYLPPFVSRAFTPFLPIHGEVARSAGGAAENPYLFRLRRLHPVPPHSWGGGAKRRRGCREPLLAAFGLWPLGHGPLQGRPAAGVQRVYLLAVPILAAGPAGGGVEGPKLRQALLLGRTITVRVIRSRCLGLTCPRCA